MLQSRDSAHVTYDNIAHNYYSNAVVFPVPREVPMLDAY